MEQSSSKILSKTAEITVLKMGLVKELMSNSTKLKDEWRKIPHLALMSENGSIRVNHRNVYTYGRWQIKGKLHIDCETGVLVGRNGEKLSAAFIYDHLPTSADEWRLDPLQVAKYLTSLRQYINMNYSTVQAWRKDKATIDLVAPIWKAEKDPDKQLRQQAETYFKLLPEWQKGLIELWEIIPELQN